MALTATARSISGTLRQQVVIAGRHRLITDEPKHLGGEDSGPAPHELFPAALAACTATTLMMYAHTKEWEIGNVEVTVDYDHKATPRAVDVTISLDGALSEEQLARLEQVARACPLRRAIETGFSFAESLEASGGRPHDAVAAAGGAS